MADTILPTADYVRQILDYDPETGALRWRTRPAAMFSSQRHCLTWNTRYAGHLLCGLDTEGYVGVSLFNRTFRGHRVAWALHYGRWPSGQIDHINGDRADNRIANLRDVDRSENAKNAAISSLNTSGVIGVSFHQNRWTAQIKANGRKIHLGRFLDFADAVEARLKAERKYGFHPNHGRPLS